VQDLKFKTEEEFIRLKTRYYKWPATAIEPQWARVIRPLPKDHMAEILEDTK